MNGIGVVIGFVTGTLVGASAIGSGSLVIPLLLLLTPVAPGTAIGTSLALATGTKLIGYLAHRKMGNVNLRLGKWLIAGALPGTAAAAVLLVWLRSAPMPAELSRQLVGLLLVLLAMLLLVASARSQWSAQESPAAGELQGGGAPLGRRAALVGAGVSLVVTLTSVGSAGLLMLALLLWRPKSKDSGRAWVAELVGTVTFYGLVAVALGTVAHMALRNIDPVLLAQLAAGSVPGVLLGARLTRVIPESYYQTGIASLNLVLGLRLALGA